MVACRPVSMAILSLVPTPSLAATRIGSLKPAALRSNSAPKPPRSASAPGRRVDRGQRLDGLDQGVAGIDVDAGVAVGDRGAVVPASWHGNLEGPLPTFALMLARCMRGIADRGRESVGSGRSRRWMPLRPARRGMADSTKPGIGASARRRPRRRPAAGGGADACGRRIRRGSGRAARTPCSRSATIPSRRARTMPSAAKDKALADGQQAAFRSLLKRLVPVTAYARIKRLAARQGRRPGRRRQGALGAQLLDRLHRQPRFLVPVEGRARPAAPRGHPVHGRAGAGAHRRSGLARGRGRLARKGEAAWTNVWKGLDLEHALTPVKLQALKKEIAPATVEALAGRRRQRHPHAGRRLRQRARPPRRRRARRRDQAAQRHADRPRRRRRLHAQAGLPRRRGRPRLRQRAGRRRLARHPRGPLEGHQVAQRRRWWRRWRRGRRRPIC